RAPVRARCSSTAVRRISFADARLSTRFTRTTLDCRRNAETSQRASAQKSAKVACADSQQCARQPFDERLKSCKRSKRGYNAGSRCQWICQEVGSNLLKLSAAPETTGDTCEEGP